MRKRIRLGVGTVVALAALAFASQAFAAYTPKLAVQMGAAGTTIHLTIPSTDDPTALLVFYAPAGTTANLGATAGTTIGTLDAKAAAGALGGATLPLTGTVEARAAGGTYLSSGVQVPLAAAATRCTGTATPRRVLGAEAHGGRPDARGAAVRRPGLGRARSGRVVLADGLPAAVRHPGEPRRRRVRREGVRGELHRQGRLHGHVRHRTSGGSARRRTPRRRARRTCRRRSSRSPTSRPAASRSARSSAC